MRGKNENFRLSTHVRLLPLTLDSKLGLTNYLKKIQSLKQIQSLPVRSKLI